MALADWDQGVIIDMNGQLYRHPKYVDTIRKADAGMVIAAGKLFTLFFFFFFFPPSVVCNKIKDDMHTHFLSTFNIFHF